MDEMNNMNEVTTEETSNEMTPVVTENNEVKTEENSGINTWVGVAAAVGVLTIGAIGARIAKHKAKAKTEPKVEKEKKPKKHFKFQCPVKIVKDEPEETKDVDDVPEEETEEN